MSPSRRGRDRGPSHGSVSLGVYAVRGVDRPRAFDAETSAQTLAAIIEDEPEPIGKLNPRVPTPVRWLVERCLTKDPRQRYDSTGDLARDLRTIRDRLGEISGQPDPALIDGTVPKRRWLTIAIVAASAALIVAVAGLLRWNTADSGIDRTASRRWPPMRDTRLASVVAGREDACLRRERERRPADLHQARGLADG